MLRIADSACEVVSPGGGVMAVDARGTARIMMPLFRGLPHEQVWCLLLSGRNSVSGAVRVAEGGLHGCALQPADVLRPVLLGGVSRFVLAHNHPSGDPTPSVSDLATTRELSLAASTVGLHLVDHLVLCPRENLWRSIREVGGIDD